MKSATNWFIIYILTVSLIAGCGGGEKAEQKSESSTTETVPPGALPDVSAEMGGDGFTGEGWLTNTDYNEIGDPRALKGGTFRFAIQDFPSTLRTNGKDANSQITRIIEYRVYQSLCGGDPITNNLAPNLATHWQISEDKQTFRFRMDPRARFSDGSRVTTADIIATWKLRVDPGILAPYTNMIWSKFEEPVAESPYILNVKSKELNWKFFLYFGGMTILPAKYIAHLTGAEYMKEFQFKMPPGSGPYKLEHDKMVRGKSLSIKRRKDYWAINDSDNKYTSNFDRIKFIVVNDERLRFEKFKKGETDAYIVGRAQWWAEETDFDNVKRGLVQKRRVYNDEAQGVAGYVFNMRKPPFDDIRMREAFTLLQDRTKLIKNLFFMQYDYLDSYYPGGIYANPDNPKYRYDPDKAVKLMAEAGWSERNEEGWLMNDKGEILQLDLTFGSKGLERIFTVYQEDLKKVGIKLDLKQSTRPTMFKMVNERKFQIHFQTWSGLFFPNPENDVSSWTADPDNTNNLAGTKNDRIDELIRLYNVEFDQEKRIEMIREIDGILMEIMPFALGWYAPFTRILYWNRFGHIESYMSRIEDWRDIFTYWWLDPELDKKLKEAKKDKSIQLDVGETEVLYWPEYNEKHGRSYTID